MFLGRPGRRRVHPLDYIRGPLRQRYEWGAARFEFRTAETTRNGFRNVQWTGIDYIGRKLNNKISVSAKEVTMKHNLVRAHHGLSWIILVCCVLQFFYAGLAVFGVTDFGLHALGGAVLALLALLNLGLAFANRRLLRRTALFLGLMIVQGGLVHLRDILPIVAAIHPVNGLALLVVAYGLARAPRPNLELVAAGRQIRDVSVAR
jgi:hypothetical protein